MTAHLSPSWLTPPSAFMSDPTATMEFKSPSVLHSVRLRQNLEESRKAFLSFATELEGRLKENSESKKGAGAPPSRKISFKCSKKTSGSHRTPRIALSTVDSNIVAELTSKFNQMVETSPKREEKRVSRKPSVKTKPDLAKTKRRNSVKRNASIVRAKVVPDKVASSGSVKAAIEIFEGRSFQTEPNAVLPKPKPKVPDKKPNLKPKALKSVAKLNTVSIPSSQVRKKVAEETDRIIERCEELANNVGNQSFVDEYRINAMVTPEEEQPRPPIDHKSESEEATFSSSQAKPNTSFLWRTKSQSNAPLYSLQSEDLYDIVSPTIKELPEPEEKIYEDLILTGKSEDCYEELERKSDDGYECFDNLLPEKERIYETLPASVLPRRQEEPLPPRPPPSRNSYCGELVSNCYESIYNGGDSKSNYESIYGCRMAAWEVGSNRESLASSDQQSNSLYGRSIVSWTNDDVGVYNGIASSERSSSDKSDEWVDISDDENRQRPAGFVIVRERQRNKKAPGWSQKLRDQWNKSQSDQPGDNGSDHHYESLCGRTREFPQHDHDDYDSFDSDAESDNSFVKIKTDNETDMRNLQLPDVPSSQSYGFSKLAVSAGKHMKKLRRNWSLTKNDITKSLSKMARRKSRTSLNADEVNQKASSAPTTPADTSPLSSITQELRQRHSDATSYQNFQYSDAPEQSVDRTRSSESNFESTVHLQPANEQNQTFEKSRSNSLTKKKFLHKFRRSISMSAEAASELQQNLENKPKSTFYLTDAIDIDEGVDLRNSSAERDPAPVLPERNVTVRPQSSPPPLPVDANQNLDSPKSSPNNKRTTSWYAEVGLFRNSTNLVLPVAPPKRSSTSWYAEIGLYQESESTPSTSSAENSGSAASVKVKIADQEEYYNIRNEADSFSENIMSYMSDSGKEKSGTPSPDIQLRLQDEPLYQFYDAAVLESVCNDGTSDFDYDGYEEVGDKMESDYSESRLYRRPTAMQLVKPSKNGITLTRTLWCEIPEVIQSAVLSTLSSTQKKLQEAKFEMMTSEASYLNSLNVLTDHFIASIGSCDALNEGEREVLFAKIPAVKRCSEKLLGDLEHCWQDNILLHGICEVIQKHAEENFFVYVSYCENQILLDSTLKKLKERNGWSDFIYQLESSSACQSLALYSFLMLPMQRITRWPLLVDAVLKRLSPQDSEYVPCQYALATLNKIVMQCNEGARRMEREAEMKRISRQIEFPKGLIQPVPLVSDSRWLVRSGGLTQMVPRAADDIKLTFGKRFTKVPLYLFLFNDILLVTKARSDDTYTCLHYCYRSYVELNLYDTITSLPTKDTQGRHLLFLTLLENHEGKTVEMLLCCASETDQERWIEALSPPKSEDPDETLYECWDCPQVTVVHAYTTSQPDELQLARGDVINVTRKMADGWYHGERIRDRETGWFPANYTVEVANPHVRARNLKQRYRLLAFSENYLKSK